MPRVRSRAGWRRYLPTWKSVLIGATALVLAVVVAVVAIYFSLRLPAVNAADFQQASYVYSADGHLIGRLGVFDRTDVRLSQVPKVVQEAVLAAEDRHYYSEPGISPTGIIRAAWVDLTGGSLQGGSTITQQFVKNAYLTQERTLTRKLKEILLAIKLDHAWSKQRVLQDYLNIIYFGRDVYGIEAAARAFFGTDVWRLNVAQGAVLAGLISNPYYYDPAVDRAAAIAKWHYVINGMVTMHWLSARRAALLRYPRVLPPRRTVSSGLSGVTGYILTAVEQELSQHGFASGQLDIGGYKIVTTINWANELDAVRAENEVLPHTPEPVSALVAVQPGTGAIRALYGGRDYGNPKLPGSFVDLATQAYRQPGSSFKPYTLITALEKGIGLNSVFNGTSPKFVPGYGATQMVSNAGNEQCPVCTLTMALARSINTVFVPLALRVGPANIRQTAYRAGIPTSDPLGGPNVGADLTLGDQDVRVIDQATGFATIAAQGVRATPYLVAKVVAQDGHVVYQHALHAKRVFSRAVMSDTTYAMEQVLDNPLGTAYGNALAGGRPAAGKTGTTENNVDAWFVGFTPQLCAAVWMGNLNGAPLTNVPGYSAGVYGGELPARIWNLFMNAAMGSQRIENFPPPAPIGTAVVSVPTATVSPQPTTTTPSSQPPSPTPPPPSPTLSVTPPVTPPPTTSSSPPSSSPPPTSSSP
jgi:membrane peptidoglycan carboxypeptidase